MPGFGELERLRPSSWNSLTREQMEAQLLRQAQTIGTMRSALTRIASGTDDQMPPFRAVPREYLTRWASEALRDANAATRVGEADVTDISEMVLDRLREKHKQLTEYHADLGKRLDTEGWSDGPTAHARTVAHGRLIQIVQDMAVLEQMRSGRSHGESSDAQPTKD